jgi:hypothetical protein
MAAPTRGLTPTDIGAIREQLSSGRRPRVVFTESAGQIAGQQGHVVALTDPAGSDEWIVVQFGRDELPFAPLDLATPTRGAVAKPSPAKRVPARVQPEPGRPPLKLTEPPAKPVPTSTAAAAKVQSAGRAEAPTPTKPATPSAPSSNGATPNGAAKVAKPRAPASLTVTLSYADREWTVAASLGSKTLAKPYLIKPTDALRIVALVDVPGVHEAVENIIVAERAEAENRAARLRTELAEIESRLAELATQG